MSISHWFLGSFILKYLNLVVMKGKIGDFQLNHIQSKQALRKLFHIEGATFFKRGNFKPVWSNLISNKIHVKKQMNNIPYISYM